MDKYLYIFLDEGGNFDFSPIGTKFFIVTCLTKERPFEAYKALAELKYDLIEQGVHIESFHATEDKQAVRDKVFDIIERHLDGIRIDSVIADNRASVAGAGKVILENGRLFVEVRPVQIRTF